MSESDAGDERRDPAIFISAGEASGDHHAAAVARELRVLAPSIRMFGLGGPEMAAAGVELLAGLDRLAVMGVSEVMRNLPFFLGLRRRVHRLIVAEDIPLVLPVDYPGFNLRLAEFAHRRGRRVLYFISPQVWAWKEGRSRTLARVCDRVLTILPFETEWLEPYGVDVEFVGHPLLDVVEPRAAEPTEPLVGLFPGSRAQEVERILPVFAEAARRLTGRQPGLRALVARSPNLPASLYAEHGIETASARETRLRATAAMTKSGTITLELALTGVPMVVGYRTRRLTYEIAKRVVRVPSIALVNLVAGEALVPELIQHELTPEAVVREIEPLLRPDSPERVTMKRGLARVRRLLGETGSARRVAEHALDLLR